MIQQEFPARRIAASPVIVFVTLSFIKSVIIIMGETLSL